MRSKPLLQVAEEVSHLCEAGAKEVVLCGIRLGAYGANLQSGSTSKPAQPEGCGYRLIPSCQIVGTLAGLLHCLREIPIARLRLSSIEPLDVSDDLIAEFAGHPSLCHHLHLPLQSGDDEILAAMGRGYRLLDYRNLVERIRRAWPDVSLTTDLMAGFPGEMDEAFENTLAAMREFDFAKVHVFRYSPRPGTPAAVMKNQVSERIKRERMEQVEAEELFQRRAERMMGEVVEVLIERPVAGGKEAVSQFGGGNAMTKLGAGFVCSERSRGVNPAGRPAAFTKAAPKTSCRESEDNGAEDKPLPNKRGKSPSRWEGLTSHYLRVEITREVSRKRSFVGQEFTSCPRQGLPAPGLRPCSAKPAPKREVGYPPPDSLTGKIVRVRIIGAGEDCLLGEVIL
jgi:hypothetical protein